MTQTASGAEQGAAAPDRPKDPQQQLIGRLIGHFNKDALTRGDTAPLRRMDPEHPHEPAFVLLMLEADAPDEWTAALKGARCWALIVHGMARMAPNHHDNSASVGSALHKAGVSELRVSRLLAARDVQFRKQMVRLARRLAQAAQPVNWFELAGLIMAEALDRKGLDSRRLRVARDYYKAQFKARNAPSKDAS